MDCTVEESYTATLNSSGESIGMEFDRYSTINHKVARVQEMLINQKTSCITNFSFKETARYLQLLLRLHSAAWQLYNIYIC